MSIESDLKTIMETKYDLALVQTETALGREMTREEKALFKMGYAHGQISCNQTQTFINNLFKDAKDR